MQSSTDAIRRWKSLNSGIDSLDLRSDADSLKSIFWNESIVEIAKIILRNIAAARKALSGNAALADVSYFEILLEPIQKSAKKAIFERNRMLEFLKSY